ncbi:hypothetical protein, partial [Parachitinimonas caeni]
MFRSTYGFISQDQSLGIAPFYPKAVDFERGIEVFEFGGLGGEDIPFEGDLYAIRYRNRIIPIVYGPETVVGVIDMCHFNRDTWSSYRGGAIEVIRACVSRFGI